MSHFKTTKETQEIALKQQIKLIRVRIQHLVSAYLKDDIAYSLDRCNILINGVRSYYTLLIDNISKKELKELKVERLAVLNEILSKSKNALTVLSND